MTKQSGHLETLREEAASWALKVDEGLGTEGERAALARWLKQSPEHVDEFLTACALLNVVSESDAALPVDLADLMGAPDETVVPFQKHQHPGGIIARHMRAISAIAAALVLAIVSFLVLQPPTPSTPDPLFVSTAFGEHKNLELADGSSLALNTATRLDVVLADEERAIRLAEGEVFATVAHDASRPFRVFAGQMPVEALGTAFNVRYLGGDLRVEVNEGIVVVGAGDPLNREAFAQRLQAGPILLEGGRVLLGPGHWMELDADGATPRLGNMEIASVAAWREDRLVFQDTPLSEVASEFNRYNRARLVVADQALAGQRISATFDARDPEALVSFLELTGEARAVRRGDEILIRAD